MDHGTPEIRARKLAGTRNGVFRSPLRIALGYAVFGLAWIWSSDSFLYIHGSHTFLGYLGATSKGSLFVLLSATLIWWLTRHEFARLNHLTTLLKAIVDGTTDAVFVKDRQGKYLLANEAVAQFVGKSQTDILGRDDRELFDSQSAEIIRNRDLEVLRDGKTITSEEQLTAAGVNRTYLATKAPYRDDRNNIVGLIGVSRDITERKRLQAQIENSQKMEALGRLAGGVAHDFNNLLTVISGYGCILQDRLPSGPDKNAVSGILDASNRAARLTKQLLAFGRMEVVEGHAIDLKSLIPDTVALLRRLISESIVLEIDISPKTPLVKADAGQIEQVIINLAINARDAMVGGGRLSIKCADYEAPVERNSVNHAVAPPKTVSNLLAPGRYAQLTISDTGEGMAPETLARIFEPFYTTKKVGEGSGLGLAVVHGIVSHWNGRIEVQSEVGRGTTFSLYFPAVDSAHEGQLKKSQAVAARGNETILLVEDEEKVREVAKAALESYGFRVWQAASAAQAMELAKENMEVIDLVVSDLIMPDCTGRSLVTSLRKMKPQCKILLMSGYSGENGPANSEGELNEPFLQKPFTPQELARKVRSVLDQ